MYSVIATAEVSQDFTSEAQEVMAAVESGDVDVSMLSSLRDAFVAYLPTIILAIVIFAVGMLVTRIVTGVTDKAMGRSRIEPTAQSFIKSLIKIVLTVFAAIIALSALGVPMTSIITTIGAAGLAVGLALQDSLSNLAGGVIILYSKPFVKGDYISTNGVEGTVEEITILNTKLITIDNKVIFIPNGSVSGATLVNYSTAEKRRVDLNFEISGDSDFRRASEIITSVSRNHPKVLENEEISARVSALSENSITITSKVWCKQGDYWDVTYDLLEQIKSALVKEGIKAPGTRLLVEEKDVSVK